MPAIFMLGESITISTVGIMFGSGCILQSARPWSRFPTGLRTGPSLDPKSWHQRCSVGGSKLSLSCGWRFGGICIVNNPHHDLFFKVRLSPTAPLSPRMKFHVSSVSLSIVSLLKP